MSDPVVSVVVPVFNTGRFLKRCLDSLVHQTLRDIEIVAVDDASTDGSAELLREYAREDRRIRIVHHEQNQGLHFARMTAVLAATGDYIGYVDSDDYVSVEMFSRLYEAAVAHDADIVRTGAHVLRDDVEDQPISNVAPVTLRFSARTYPSGIEYLNADFYPAMWLHLHRRRLWEQALPHFPRIRLVGEDNLTAFVLAYFARTVVSLPAVDYSYVEREDSLSAARTVADVTTHIRDRSTIVRLLRAFLDSHGDDAEPGWMSLKDNNKGLVFEYIRSLGSLADRTAAIALFESAWGEQFRPT